MKILPTIDPPSSRALIAITILTLATRLAAGQLPAGTPDPPTLSVAGDAQVTAPPDYATVRLGVVEQGDDAVAAQRTANEVMRKIIERIKELGLADKDIQTDQLNLSPVYATEQPRRQSEKRRIVGYQATSIIQARFEDLDKIGEVIDAGVQSGANNIEGVDFQLKDDLAQRTQALKLAAEEARAKARALAEAMDLKLVGIRKVSVGEFGVHSPRLAMASRADFAGAATPIQPGEVRISATVNVEYEIENAAD